MLLLLSLAALAQQPGENAPPPRSVPQRNAGESSSKDTKVDLTPPPGEIGLQPDIATSDTHELHPWNPHNADKNVEIGDFYLKRRNYRAAVSRYREALYWQDNHAIATFRLAETLEKLGQISEARKNYQSYLKILPKGPSAADARKALDRLKDKPDTPTSAQTGPLPPHR